MKNFKSKYQITESPDEIRWRSYLKNNPCSNIFHTPEMFEVFQRTQGYTPRKLAVLGPENQLLSICLPVLVSLNRGFLKKATTRAIHYGGILHDDRTESIDSLQELLPECLRQCGREAIFTELRHLADPQGIVSVLGSLGFRYEEHINFLVDLDQPLDDVWHRITAQGRRAVKRSRKRGLVIEEITKASQVTEFYHLLSKTYRRKRIPLIDISHFQAIYDILVPMNMAKIYRARAENRTIAGMVVFLYKDTLYWWYSGDNFEFRQYYPTDGILWHILEWGWENGFKTFDVGWAGRPGQPYGVRKFKEKYGGRVVTWGRHRYVHAPFLMRFSTWGYGLYRGLCKMCRSGSV